ncbi:MAG: hypothetical protein AAGE76_12250 [Pseudomonadota bacterium]
MRTAPFSFGETEFGMSRIGRIAIPEAVFGNGFAMRLPVRQEGALEQVRAGQSVLRGKSRTRRGAVLIDYYLLESNWRLTGGVAFGGGYTSFTGENLNLHDTSTGQQYTLIGSYEASVRPREMPMPVAAFGYRTPLGGRVQFNFDLGIQMNDSRLSLDTSEFQADPLFDRTDIEAAIRSFNDDQSLVTPFARIGFNIRF